MFFKGFAVYKTNFYLAAKDLSRDITHYGCGDNSCLFNKPKGMATNGGCRCHDKLEQAFREAYMAGVENSVKNLK